jgi:hypothetical protein
MRVPPARSYNAGRAGLGCMDGWGLVRGWMGPDGALNAVHPRLTAAAGPGSGREQPPENAF